MTVSYIGKDGDWTTSGTTVSAGGTLTFTDDDLIIAFVHMNGDGRTVTGLDGFTQWQGGNVGGSGGSSYALLYKTASSDSGDFTFTVDTSTRISVQMVQVRGAAAMETDVFTLGSPEASSASFEYPTITVANNSFAMGVGLYDNISWLASDSFIDVSDGYSEGGELNPNATAGQAQCFVYKAWTTGQATTEVKNNRNAISADHVPLHFSFKEGAGGGGLGIPIAMHHYKQLRGME